MSVVICPAIRMDAWTFALLVIACVAIYQYFKRKLSYFSDRAIPHTPGWPIVGNMAPNLFRRKHINHTVQDLYNHDPEAKYVGVYDFMRPVILLRDPELIKTVTIKNFDSFPDHYNFFDDTIDPLFGGALFNMAGERWKEARALLSPAFTSSKMRAMNELIVDCVKNTVRHLSALSPKEQKMVDSKDLFTRFTNDAIATSAFGISVDSLRDPTNDFYVLGKEATNFDGLALMKFFVFRFSPQLARLLGLTLVNQRVAKFFTNIVRSTIETRDREGIRRPDMLQLMMDAREKESENLKLDITTMTAQAFIFFFGGFDTSSTQMCTIAHELAINPDVQKRLQKEIDDVMQKTSGNPSYNDIQNMPYLDAVFNESMRLHTQSGFADRLCTKAFELPPALPGGKPFVIEAGMSIWFSPYAIHRDPKYYENPDKFEPERYLDKKVTINDAMNLGFGIGPRSCIGNRFAILENKTLFFYLLHEFNLKPNEKTCSPLVYNKASFNIKPDGGFSLSVEPRRSK